MDAGRYRIIEALGEGGMGQVLLAEDTRLGRQVALKLLRNPLHVNERQRQRFLREARIVAALSHPNIVQVYDVDSIAGHDCIVMEYVPGRDLRRYLREHPPLSLGQVVELAVQIAHGMAALHDNQIVHRDLKCENILVRGDGLAKIADFGIARPQDDQSTTGDSRGTLCIMSPEQVRHERCDSRSDMFSFAILLCEALSGVSPFKGETNFETMSRILYAPPNIPSSTRQQTPAALLSLIDQMLHKEPERRPRDFHDIGRVLAEITASEVHAGDRVSLAHSNADTPTAEVPLEGIDIGVSLLRPAVDETAPGSKRDPLSPVEPADRLRPNKLLRARGASAAMAMVLPVLAFVALTDWFAPGPQPVEPMTPPGSIFGPIEKDGLGLPRIAVLPTVISPGPLMDRDLEVFARACQRTVQTLMLYLEDRHVIRDEDVLPVWTGQVREHGLQPPVDGIMNALAVDQLIQSSLTCDSPAHCRLSLSRIDRNGEYIARAEVQLDMTADDSLDTIPRMLERPDHRPWPSKLMSLSDHQRFEQLMLDYRQQTARTPEGFFQYILRQLETLQEHSADAPQIDLLRAEILLARASVTGDATDPRRQRAHDLLSRVRHLAPGSRSLAVHSFLIAIAGGDLEHASRLLYQLPLATIEPEWHTVLDGRLQVKRKDFGQARALLAQVSLEQYSWRAALDLAFVEKRLGNIESAHRRLEQLAVRTPGNYDVLAQQVRLEFERGDYACANAHYSHLALRLRTLPEFQSAMRRQGFAEHHNLGVVALLLGDYSFAEEHLTQAIDMSSARKRHHSVYYDHAEALRSNGRNAEAQVAFREYLQRSRGANSAQVIRLRAQAWAHIANLPGTEESPDDLPEELQTFLRRSAGSGSVDDLYALASIHQLLGQTGEARRYAQSFIEQEPSVAYYWFRFHWFSDLRWTLGQSNPSLLTPPTATCSSL